MFTRDERVQAIKFQDAIGETVDQFLREGMDIDHIRKVLRDKANSRLEERRYDLAALGTVDLAGWEVRNWISDRHVADQLPDAAYIEIAERVSAILAARAEVHEHGSFRFERGNTMMDDDGASRVTFALYVTVDPFAVKLAEDGEVCIFENGRPVTYLTHWHDIVLAFAREVDALRRR